jgi:formylglycine-generating enzyme required for sulfatase activity
MEGDGLMMSAREVARAAALAVLVLLAAGTVQADVFNLGGVRDPVTGTWTGVASLETVSVGNPGNAADTQVMNDGTTGYGSVAYSYNIGKYDVTAGQYAAFLNAVAATDTYGLYNPLMHSDADCGCQIQRLGTSGNYFYIVASTYANRPVNYVSYGDAMRFANWLHNGQPTGTQGLSTTENGAYYLNGATADAALLAVGRKAGSRWAVTSEDEWYKAAYYNAATGLYNVYATGNSISTDMANYNWSVGHPSDVGLYPYASPCGTFDQTGNVAQWNEAIISGSFRGMRGGPIGDSYYTMFLLSTNRDSFTPSTEGYGFGFRVSELPEPATLSLLALGGLAILRHRRRTSK